MKLFLGLFAVELIFSMGGWAQAQATIEGHIDLPKSPTAEVINKRYESDGEPGVIIPDPPAAVVYLDGVFAPAKQPATAQMAQKNLDFVPRLLPVRVGTKVEFPNQDPTYHSVFSFSQPKRFDLGRYRGDETPIPSVIFDKPGPVVCRCDIHENMRAIILVLLTPYFARTDAKGDYRIGGLPSGSYTFCAWLNDKTVLQKHVELQKGTTLHVNFP
ncbi:MAG TPA: carboxypeptidase regulatory-like domain-containing protein [Candidatus Methylacidiphilales bacterium]